MAQSKLDQAIAKAYEQLQKGKPDEAVKTLTKAAEGAGAEGQLALAQLHERLGNLEDAGAAYNQARATASGPGRANILAAVAEFTLRTGTARDGLAVAKDAVAAGATAAALAAQARALVRSENGPEALTVADKAVAADASSSIAHTARGEALIASGSWPTPRRPCGAPSSSTRSRPSPTRASLSPSCAWGASRTRSAPRARPQRSTTSSARASPPSGRDARRGPQDLERRHRPGPAGAFLDPKNPIVQAAVGKVFEANGQLEQASNAYRRALEADPAFAPPASP